MSFLFGKTKIKPVEEIDPAEDARELRRRIAARGGFQSTLLAGRSSIAQANVFKSNLAGTIQPKKKS